MARLRPQARTPCGGRRRDASADRPGAPRSRSPLPQPPLRLAVHGPQRAPPLVLDGHLRRPGEDGPPLRPSAAGTFEGPMNPDPLATFPPGVRDWFTRSFEAPTPAQAQAWPAIASGENVLVSAPTGSGKTLAAFLWALDRLVAEP